MPFEKGNTLGITGGEATRFKKGDPRLLGNTLRKGVPSSNSFFVKGHSYGKRFTSEYRPAYSHPKGVIPSFSKMRENNELSPHSLWKKIPALEPTKTLLKDVKIMEKLYPATFAYSVEEAQKIKDILYHSALEGNEAALKIVSDKCLKKTTHFSVNIDKVNLNSLHDVVVAMNKLINLAHVSSICHEDFSELASAYETHFKMIKDQKTDALEQVREQLAERVDELKNAQPQ